MRFKREQGIHLETLKVIRWAGYMQYVMNRDSKKRLMKPQELLDLNEPEGEKVLDLPSPDEMKEMQHRMDK